MKLHTRTKYQRLGLLVSDKKIFSNFAYTSLCKQMDLSVKKGQGQLNVIIFFKHCWAAVPSAAYQAPGP